jgi:hypothetical protein
MPPWMRLITAKNFAIRYFDETARPDPRTVTGWVKRGLVRGRMVGTKAFVDAEAWEATTGSRLLDRILDARKEGSRQRG